MATLFVPIVRVKQFLELEDVADDQPLLIVAEGVTGLFQDYCDRSFFRQTDIYEIVDADGSDCFLVREPPISGINDIWVSPDGTWDATTVVDSQYYEYEAQRGIVYWRNYSVGEATRSIRIQYAGGWLASAIPLGIQRAFLAQVRHEFERRRYLSERAITDPSGSRVEQYGFELLPEVRATLNRYRVDVL